MIYQHQTIEAIERFDDMPDFISVSGGNLVQIIFQELNEIFNHPNQTDFYQYIRFINLCIVGYSIEYLRNDLNLLNTLLKNITVVQDTFPFLNTLQIQRIVELSLILIVQIHSTLSNNMWVINLYHPKGQCYRIIRYDTQSITLGKFIPYQDQ